MYDIHEMKSGLYDFRMCVLLLQWQFHQTMNVCADGRIFIIKCLILLPRRADQIAKRDIVARDTMKFGRKKLSI